MSLIELFIIAAGLSMDAFAVAICKGRTDFQSTGRHEFHTAEASTQQAQRARSTE